VPEEGDPEPIAPALDKLARTRRLAQKPLTAQSDIAHVIATLEAPGPGPMVRTA
jgi:hypothetical protein